MEVREAEGSLSRLLTESAGVPATIGILNGVARVGMSPKELEELTSSVNKQEVLKISRRDLAYACGSVRSSATHTK